MTELNAGNIYLPELSSTGHTRTLRRFLPLYVVIFIGYVGYSLMITVFTPLLMRGDSPLLAVSDPTEKRTIILGILLCLYPLGQFFGSPIVGSLSDHYGRKPILLVSLAATTVCYSLIALSLSISSLPLLMAASLLAGLAESNIVCAQGAIADASPSSERNRFFGYIYMSVSAAYIIGPLVGGKLADPQIVPWFNYATPFWAIFILLTLTVIATAILFRETHNRRADEAVRFDKALTNLTEVFTNKRLRNLFGLNFLSYLAIFGFFRCYPMYLVDQFHLGVSRISEFIAWVGVPIVLANLWLTSWLSNRFTTKTIAVWSGLLTGVFMLLVVLPRQVNALWVTLFLTSAALAPGLPSYATLLSTSASQDEQGKVMGNNQSVLVGAEALSGLIGGLLAAIMVKLSLVALGVIAILSALLLSRYRLKTRP